MSIEKFAQATRGFSRNPLGILALFVLLVYALAGLVLSVSGENVGESQRWTLIWFLVVFPILTLMAFYRLVTKHHTKLYAPGDYRDEGLFLQSLTIEEQRARIISDAGTDQPGDRERDSAITPRQELNGAGVYQGGIANYLLAEELALRHFEAEIGAPVKRHVRLDTPRWDLKFDGFVKDPKGNLGVEVKLLRGDSLSEEVVQTLAKRLLDTATFFAHFNKEKFRLIVILVTGSLPTERRMDLSQQTREAILSAVSQKEEDWRRCTVEVDVKVYVLDELAKGFGLAS